MVVIVVVVVVVAAAVDFPPVSVRLVGRAALAHPRQEDPGLGRAGLVDGDVGVDVEASRHVSASHSTWGWSRVRLG